jgi:hypothetical protein
MPFSAAPTAILDDRCGLVLPVLPPVFRHNRLADGAVFLDDAHLENVNEADELAVVDIDVNFLRAPRLIRRRRSIERRIGSDLKEIERHAIFARHRQDRAAVALEAVDVLFLQTLPRRRAAFVQHDWRSLRGTAARLRRLRIERPRERISRSRAR